MIALVFGVNTQGVLAGYYYHANGGSYWLQYGSEWSRRNNDGYCVSGRGPCGSSLWYQQSSMNHKGCGYSEWGNWKMSKIVDAPYKGKVSAWIDGTGGGTMPAANYSMSYENGSSYYKPLNQNLYWETFAPLAELTRITNVTLTDSWGGQYICNTVGGYRVEFDEIRLEV